MTVDGMLLAAVVLAAAVCGVVALVVVQQRRLTMAAVVGGTGALMGVQVGGVHVFTAAVALWWLLTRPRPSQQWPRILVLGTAAGLVASTVLYGELVNSSTLALQLLALAGSASLIALRAEADDTAMMVKAALTVITLGTTVGLLQVVGIVPIETWHAEISAIGRPQGIWPEPDWLGLMAAVGVVLGWFMPMPTLLRTTVLVINFGGFVLAFARAAWVALAVAVVFLILVRLFARPASDAPRTGRRSAVITLLVLGALAVSVSPALRDDLGRRIETLTTRSSDDVSGKARIQQTEGLLYLAETAAPIGHGLSASGRVGVSGKLYLDRDAGNNVASNWVLGLWVDGAFMSVPLMLFLFWFGVRGVVHPVGQAFLVVLFNSLFSNALFQPVTWLLLGLTMAAMPPSLRIKRKAEAPPTPAVQGPAVPLAPSVRGPVGRRPVVGAAVRPLQPAGRSLP